MSRIFRPEAVREDFRQDGPYDDKTRAEDTDIHLNTGPDGNALGVRWINPY